MVVKWYNKVSKKEQNSDRYDILQAKYLLLGFSNLSEALAFEEFYMWVRNLSKYNKNAGK